MPYFVKFNDLDPDSNDNDNDKFKFDISNLIAEIIVMCKENR